MEIENENEESSQDVQLVNTNRNTVRTLAFQSALHMTDMSFQYLLLKILYNLGKILACLIIVNNHKEPLERPLFLFIYLIIGVDVCVVIGYILKIIQIFVSIHLSVRVAFGLMRSLSIM